MKTFTIVLVLFALSQSLYGQVQGKTFKINSFALIERYDDDFKPAGKSSNLNALRPGYRFTVLNSIVKGNQIKYVIKVHNYYSESDAVIKKNQLFSEKKDKTVEFLLKEESETYLYLLDEMYVNEALTKVIEPKGWQKLGLSAVTLPFRLRFGKKGYDSSFQQNVSLGANLNFKNKLSEVRDIFLGVYAGIALSSIQINDVDFNFGENGLNPNETYGNQNAFTWNIGGYFEWDKLQITLGFGSDYLPSKFRNAWNYDRIWLSFGFGIDLVTGTSANTFSTLKLDN